jgi:TPR repeat protein
LKIIILLLLAITTVNSYATKKTVDKKHISTVINAQKAGVKYHKQAEFEKAFEKLSISAQGGIKQSQYLLGIMYFKGQYVKQSLATGMAWLGVANEIHIKDWKATYNNIYNKLNAKQQEYIDKIVAEYIERYGMKTQKLTCKKKASLGSRKIQIYCNYQKNGSSTNHELEKLLENDLFD